MADRARERMDRLGEIDAASQDVIIEVVRALEQQLWMVRVQFGHVGPGPMSPVSRGFLGRRRPVADPSRLPPGQYLETGFPVLSAGPTPQRGGLWRGPVPGRHDGDRLREGPRRRRPEYWQAAPLLKHFLANSNENNRTRTSSDFDERLFWEYYSMPFRMAFQDGGRERGDGVLQCWNGVPMAVNPVLKSVVIDQWHVGIVSSDGGAIKTLVKDHKTSPDQQAAAVAALKAGINQYLDVYKDELHAALKARADQRGRSRRGLRAQVPHHDQARPARSARARALCRRSGRHPAVGAARNTGGSRRRWRWNRSSCSRTMPAALPVDQGRRSIRSP